MFRNLQQPIAYAITWFLFEYNLDLIFLYRNGHLGLLFSTLTKWKIWKVCDLILLSLNTNGEVGSTLDRDVFPHPFKIKLGEQNDNWQREQGRAEVPHCLITALS